MQARILALSFFGAAILAGCARWEPQHRPGPVAFDHACPLRRAPAVASFGATGMRAVYHYAAANAPGDELGAFIHAAETTGFNVVPVMVEMNGADTLIVQGPAVLRDQRAVDREFGAACRLRQQHIYLTHVRHNPPGPPGQTRVR